MDNIKRIENETQFDFVKRMVYGKLINKTIDAEYEELSELIFGEGNSYNSSEVRKRFYGMRFLFELLDSENTIHVANRILSISDLHIPFQLPVTTFEKYVGKVDILQINGDVLDCQSISKFPKTYRISMMEEIISCRKYLIELIEYIKPKKVVVNYGNHDMRFQSYLAKNLDSDLLELMPETPLELILVDGFNHNDKRNKTKTWYEPLNKVFSDVEIEYTYNWYNQIGDTIFCHPSSFNSGILKTAERAMTWFRNEGFIFSNLIMAHTHRVGSYKVGNTMINEQGTCSDTKKQHYCNGRMVNSQKEGFIYICQDKDGNTIHEKTDLVCLN